MKKKKKEKHKKRSKKSKSNKKEKYYSDTDSTEDEDEWQEASTPPVKIINKDSAPPVKIINKDSDCSTAASLPLPSVEKDEQNKRQEWMLSSSLLDVACNTSNVKENKTKQRKIDERRKEEEKSREIHKSRELNPYLKEGKPSFPEEGNTMKSQTVKSYCIGDSGQSWIHKAFERAKEQAKNENVPLEDIVAIRWGSMQKLEALLKAASRTSRPSNTFSKRSGNSGWRKGTSHSERKHENIFCKYKDPHRLDEPIMANKIHHSATIPDSIATRETAKLCLPQDGYPSKSDTVLAAAPDVSENHIVEEKESSSNIAVPLKEVPVKPLSEKDKNEINAKILRAELMGDDETVEELKRKLEPSNMPSDHKKTEKSSPGRSKKNGSSSDEGEEVILTRRDKHGNLYPIKLNEDVDIKKRRKKKIMSTHDESGKRVRYFEDDDTTNLKTMVEQERLTSVDDQQVMLARLAGKHLGRTMGEDYTIDDMFVQASATKGETKVENRHIKEKAIAEHKQHKLQLSKCRYCLENPNIVKHLIITIGLKVYLTLPITASLTEGHCLIVPINHIIAQTFMDEDVIQEMRKFKKTLTRMFAEMGEDVIFLETRTNIHGNAHCVVECVPIPKEVGDMAPIYFKKAITESGSEWSQNKKLIVVNSKHGVMKAVPKGLPYFAVEFGLDGGFAHIIEEQSFPFYFGKEIIGGMMDLEPRLWRNPPKESFEQHKRKVFKFNDLWKESDWTK